MSDLAVGQALPTGAPPVPDRPLVARSWLAGVVLRTVGQISARVGLVWIGTIAFCAVFAPLLASSYPILLRVDNKWSSPLAAHLTAVDWTLLAAVPVVGVLLLLKSLSFARRFGIFLSITLALLTILLLTLDPKRTNVYDQFRALDTTGRVQSIWRTPIPYSPSDRLRDQFDAARPHPWAPSRDHWMGTEINGGDILSNMIHGCRIAMSVGFISTGIALVIGIFVGAMMGYFAGVVDLVGMRLVEIFSAIPRIYLLLAFVAFYDRNIYIIMAIIGVTGWVGDARFVRAEFLKLRNLDFVHAAIAAGLPLRSVLFRHILPNALAPLLVSASFGVAGAILAESTLSFLGLGLIDEPSWGRLLDQARAGGGGFHWWLATFPGIAIFLTVLAYNLIGESLRDALDPKLSGGQ